MGQSSASRRIELPRWVYGGLFFLGLLCYLGLSSHTLWAIAPPPAQTAVGSPQAEGTGGAVATTNAQATQVGIDILAQGGNAVDAAIATAAALGVVEPFSCGIGGGDFMVIKLASSSLAPSSVAPSSVAPRGMNRADESSGNSSPESSDTPAPNAPYVITIDGREQAPRAITPDLFRDPHSPTGDLLPFYPNRISSGVAVGVPGALSAWAEAIQRYGRLSLAEVLAPAIALAEEGFAVTPTFHNHIVANQERFAAFQSTRALYLPNGAPPDVGGLFKNPDLAHTYRVVATAGVNAFYRGPIAEAIAHTVQHPPTVDSPPFPVIPGTMTPADLDLYHVRVRPPVSTSYRGYQVYGMGLPSSGGITSFQVLNLLEGMNLKGRMAADIWHRVIEAERLAYGDRNRYLGDPEYVDVPVNGLLNPDYADTRRALMGDRAPANSAQFQAEPGNPFPYQQDPSPSGTAPAPLARHIDGEGWSTTHLTVADRWGTVVSHTLTIESTGGSGMVVPGYGFLLNNELTDFNPVVPHANAPEPGKRPRSSMAPTIMLGPDGDLMAFGSPGGSTIITTVLGIAVNTVDLGLSLADAIAAPRLSQRNGGTTLVDGGLEQTDTGQALIQLGHDLRPVPALGDATGIYIGADGIQMAIAEPTRRGGGAAQVVYPR